MPEFVKLYTDYHGSAPDTAFVATGWDTVMLFATDVKNTKIKINKALFNKLSIGVYNVMLNLSKQIVSDGEGISKLIEVNVFNANNYSQASRVAFSVAESILVKTAVAGEDANWGRILAAVGRARVKGISFENINISLNEVQIISSGEISEQYTEEAGSREMGKPEITIQIDLGGFKTNESVWTTDLSYDYVKINAEYRS